MPMGGGGPMGMSMGMGGMTGIAEGLNSMNMNNMNSMNNMNNMSNMNNLNNMNMGMNMGGGGMGGMSGINLGLGLGRGGSGGVMLTSNNNKFRFDGKGNETLNQQQESNLLSQPYYFHSSNQQQNLTTMNSIYGGPPSPLHVLHTPMSPLGSPQIGQMQPMFLTSHMGHQQQQHMQQSEFSNSANTSKRNIPTGNNNRGRKSVPFPLEIPSMSSISSDPNSPPPSWYNALGSPLTSMHMSPYLQAPLSPVNHPQSHNMQHMQHMNLALMSPSSQTSTQSSHSLGHGHHLMRPPPRKSLNIPNHSPSNSFSGGVTLNIANLPSDASVSLLHDLFSPYGKVINATIEPDNISALSGQRPYTSKGKVSMAALGQAEYAAQGILFFT
jgi:hypothetical protein